MFIPDPDFFPSRTRISNSKTATKETREKICRSTFYCSHKYPKIAIYFIFQRVTKEFGSIYKELQNFCYKKLSLNMVWDPGFKIRDPGSEKNIFWIPDPEVKKAPNPGSGTATLFMTKQKDRFSILTQKRSVIGNNHRKTLSRIRLVGQ